MKPRSSIHVESEGEVYGASLKKGLTARHCSNDKDYPISIEGTTKEGDEIAVSLTAKDAMNLYHELQGCVYSDNNLMGGK